LKLEGRYEFAAPRQVVWNFLLDPKALQHCMPGCKKFDPVGDDRFEVILEMGVAGIKGTYTGKAQIADRNPPHSYKLVVEGSGTPGSVRGEGVMTLEENGNATTVVYVGDASASGLIANVGQRMLGGVAKMVVGQFFECMKNQVASAGGA
jgi:carbon monoxide dehydrogenase subunit G